MIVITELAFAFGVGISCVVFSFNLVKAVRRENGELSDDESQGEAGAGTGVETEYLTFARSSASSGNSSDLADEDLGHASSDASDRSVEEVLGSVEESELTLLDGALRNFTDYLRVW